MQRVLPSYPLFVKDPNFSLWMPADDPTQANVTSWWGEKKPVYGFVKTEEGTYCFLGAYDDVKDCGVLRAEAQDVKVSSFTTDYTFRAGKATLAVSFVSPLPPNDLDLLSLPACYLNFEVTGVKSAEVSLFVNRRVCYNDIAQTQDKQVRGGVAKQEKYEAAFFGLRRQMYLSNNDDGIGADWGYWYVAGKEAYLTDSMGLAAYLAAGNRSFPHRADEKYIVALGGKKGRIAVAY
ncbi:MAG: DUF5127 domain-containing protein, partial [Clostridiales bacterium]|nr:DUF5127 domain-containing protein [Clostridiales bacterium]